MEFNSGFKGLNTAVDRCVVTFILRYGPVFYWVELLPLEPIKTCNTWGDGIRIFVRFFPLRAVLGKLNPYVETRSAQHGVVLLGQKQLDMHSVCCPTSAATILFREWHDAGTSGPSSRVLRRPADVFMHHYLTAWWRRVDKNPFIPYTNTGCKVKLSHYRPWQVLRTPGGWDSQFSRQLEHEGGKVASPTHRPPLPPGDVSGTHFC